MTDPRFPPIPRDLAHRPGTAWVDTLPQDGFTVVRAGGELDMSSLPVLRAALTAAGARGPVAVDCSEVTVCSTATMRELHAHTAGTPGRALVASRAVRRVLELAELAAVVPLCGSVTEAVARLGSGETGRRGLRSLG